MSPAHDKTEDSSIRSDTFRMTRNNDCGSVLLWCLNNSTLWYNTFTLCSLSSVFVLTSSGCTVALNWLAGRCDSQWQQAGAHWASLWADHINYAKQQLEQEGGGDGRAVSLRNKRTAGGIYRSQPAVSRDDRTGRPELRSRFLKYTVGGQKH